MCAANDGAPAPAPGRAPWRGVSLGGWLLLEPGPAKELFARHLGEDGEEAKCEWGLMRNLQRTGALKALQEHRESYIGRHDFQRIRDMELNAVRVPFGYWVVLGSTSGDPFQGPALEYLDRAVDWAAECGLQVLLDLHGCPGGESGEAPSGRHQRPPASRWSWRRWRFKETLRALAVVARRYRVKEAVTGIAVCNEPSPEVPAGVLCSFYRKAVETIRQAGMGPDRVTVVLPAFQRPVSDVAGALTVACAGGPPPENVCFEVHWYHCFENSWHGRTFAQHLRAVQDHTDELRRHPIVVGEWSLALGRGAQPGKLSAEEMRTLFGHAQLTAYREASHGWFFWTWRDHSGVEWDWQQSRRQGYLPREAELCELPELPPCPNAREDPLEKVFDRPASDPVIRMGDTVYLRTFNGKYLDVEDEDVRARFSDRGLWQQFVLCPTRGALTAVAPAALRDGDSVRLLAHTSRFLGVDGTSVLAKWDAEAADRACVFVVRASRPGDVRHRTAVCLQSAASGNTVAPNEDGQPERRDVAVARWPHLGEWQQLTVEKPLTWAVTPPRPRRRRSFPGEAVPAAGAPLLRRSSSASSAAELLGEVASTPRRQPSGCSKVGTMASPAGCARAGCATPPQSRKRRSSGPSGVEALNELPTPSRRRRCLGVDP